MKKGASPEQIEHVKTLIASFGYRIHESVGAERTLLGAIGDERGKERPPASRPSRVWRRSSAS